MSLWETRDTYIARRCSRCLAGWFRRCCWRCRHTLPPAPWSPPPTEARAGEPQCVQSQLDTRAHWLQARRLWHMSHRLCHPRRMSVGQETLRPAVHLEKEAIKYFSLTSTLVGLTLDLESGRGYEGLLKGRVGGLTSDFTTLVRANHPQNQS